jgi:plastocyanin
MRRWGLGLLVAVIASSAPGAAPARSTAVGVGLREFTLAPYRDRVRPGTVRFNVSNLGEDAHNLVVRTRRGRVVADSGTIRAGDQRTLRVRLPNPGRFVLVCTTADHEALGMKARLTVSRRARR